MNKAFSLFLMVALILGASLGGAFAGGVALGKTQGEPLSEVRSSGSLSQGPGGGSGGDRGQGRGQGSGPGGDQRFGQRGPASRGRVRVEAAGRVSKAVSGVDLETMPAAADGELVELSQAWKETL